MADAVFQIGDLVKLKSGGPTMTISGASFKTVDGSVLITCAWFPDGSPTPATHDFAAAALVLTK